MPIMFRRAPIIPWVLVSTLTALTIACQGGGEDDGTGGGDGSGGMGGTGAGTGGAGGLGSCDAPTGPGTEISGTIEGEVTWNPEGSPYVVSGDVLVEGDLVLEACTVVRLEVDAGFTVRGSMTAEGEFESTDDGVVVWPVSLEPLVSGESWGGIEVEPQGLLDFTMATIHGGGTREATIHAYGEDQYGLPHRNVRLLHVSISDAANYGVMLETRAAFSEDSTDLVISRSGSEESPFPIHVEAGAVSSIPNLYLQDNVVDEILIVPVRQVEEDTIPNVGFPYRVRGALVVARENGVTSEDVSTLTIEPGVTLRMETHGESGLHVGAGSGNEGRLIAVGTADLPIRFESAADEPAAGDWLGLYFHEPVATGNQVEYVEVAQAGALSGAQGYGCGPIENHASILVLNQEPVPQFIENTTIEEAGGDTQILLGWDYDADPMGAAQAILESNTFDSSGPACQVSLPQDETSQCPGLDAEPDCLAQ